MEKRKLTIYYGIKHARTIPRGIAQNSVQGSINGI